MSRRYAPERRRVYWVSALLGLLTLEVIATSCAGAESSDESDARTADSAVDGGRAVEGGAVIDATVDATHDAKGPCGDVEWCPVPTNYPAGRAIVSVWGSGANDVWVVGAEGGVSHWDGYEWTFASVGTTWALQAVWGTGPDDVWAVSAPSKIFRMTGLADGGAPQWSPVTAVWEAQGFKGTLNTIWGTSPDDVWVTGNFNIRRTGISVVESGWRTVSVDGGVGWAPTSSFSNHDIKSIWGSGPEDIWVVGATGSLTSRLSFAAHTNGVAADGGAPTWTAYDTGTISVLYAAWGSGPGDVWAVGDYGTILHFTAGTNKWTSVDSPTTEDLHGVWGAGPDDIWAVGERGTLVHYDGVAWTASSAAFSDDKKPDLHGVWGSGPSDVWAVGNDVVLHFSGFKPGAKRETP